MAYYLYLPVGSVFFDFDFAFMRKLLINVFLLLEHCSEVSSKSIVQFRRVSIFISRSYQLAHSALTILNIDKSGLIASYTKHTLPYSEQLINNVMRARINSRQSLARAAPMIMKYILEIEPFLTLQGVERPQLVVCPPPRTVAAGWLAACCHINRRVATIFIIVRRAARPTDIHKKTKTANFTHICFFPHVHKIIIIHVACGITVVYTYVYTTVCQSRFDCETKRYVLSVHNVSFPSGFAYSVCVL